MITMSRRDFERRLTVVRKSLEEQSIIQNNNGNPNGCFSIEWLLKIADLLLHNEIELTE